MLYKQEVKVSISRVISNSIINFLVFSYYKNVEFPKVNFFCSLNIIIYFVITVFLFFKIFYFEICRYHFRYTGWAGGVWVVFESSKFYGLEDGTERDDWVRGGSSGWLDEQRYQGTGCTGHSLIVNLVFLWTPLSHLVECLWK